MLNAKFDSSKSSVLPTDISTVYFKLLYLKFSTFTQCKVRTLVNKYCKNLTVKLAFSSFKMKNLIDLNVPDVIPCILAKQADIYLLVCVSIYLVIKIPISLNI